MGTGGENAEEAVLVVLAAASSFPNVPEKLLYKRFIFHLLYQYETIV